MALKFQALLFSFFVGIQVALGVVLLNNLEDFPHEANDYDFVIVGGGLAGSVVATRLGENPTSRILVIEAGPEEIFETRVPGLWPTLAQTRVDWNFTTTPQQGLNGRTVEYPRAKMLGGCSSHNGMVYTRGSSDDWDRYARMAGNTGLTWKNILPVMFKVSLSKTSTGKIGANIHLANTRDFYQTEHLTKPVPSGHLDPTVHGKSGKVSVAAPFSNIAFNNMLLQASAELKEEFPFLLDMNAGRAIGIGWVQSTVDNGERSSAVTGYLNETSNNVHALLNTLATRVFPVNQTGLEFRGVEVAANAQGPRRQIIAKKEVIVSGGAINTPQVLLNSGIGSSEELKKFGILTLVNNPSVGKNFSDQTSTPVAFAARTQSTDFDQQAALKQWNESRTGPLSRSLLTNHITWVRLPANSPPFQSGFIDPTGGPNSPHIEMIWTSLNTISSSTADPASTPQVSSGGSITLASSDPFDQPLIDFGMFIEPMDIAIAREGIRSARRLYSAPGVKDSVLGTTSPAANVTSDEELDAYIRNVTSPLGHVLGTAAMSPRNASWGVVDPDFRVKGTKGLRIVDASVIKLEIDSFSGYRIYPSKGTLFVRSDSKVFRFASSKNASLFRQRKNPRKIAWTQVYRRMHKKGITEEVAKKRSRRTVKHQRGIVGADLNLIASKRNEIPAVRLQQRMATITKAKNEKKEKEAKKTSSKPSRPAQPSGPKVSKQQMKGGKGGR
ncbi:Choline dehydrogenase, mitochondrial [Leucoagaricus sp. SymC.cos]|nr:Choline dehydrogenase, mitochondrial [Leucoagaricus sp. SymC.cos]